MRDVLQQEEHAELHTSGNVARVSVLKVVLVRFPSPCDANTGPQKDCSYERKTT